MQPSESAAVRATMASSVLSAARRGTVTARIGSSGNLANSNADDVYVEAEPPSTTPPPRNDPFISVRWGTNGTTPPAAPPAATPRRTQTMTAVTAATMDTNEQIPISLRFRTNFIFHSLFSLATGIAALVILLDARKAQEGAEYCGPNLKLWVIQFPLRLFISSFFAYYLWHNWNDDIPALLQTQHIRNAFRMSEILRYIGLGFFFVANSWINRASPECKETDLYKLGLALLIISFILLLIPLAVVLLLLIGVFCCLPLALRILGHAGVVVGGQHPASALAVNRLAEVKYRPGMQLGMGTTTATASDTSGPTTTTATPPTLTPTPECAICMMEYETDDALRILPCGFRHHFHKACIDSWLVVNANCPVCRRIVIATPGSGPVGTLPPTRYGGGGGAAAVGTAPTTTATTTTAAAVVGADETIASSASNPQQVAAATTSNSNNNNSNSSIDNNYRTSSSSSFAPLLTDDNNTSAQQATASSTSSEEFLLSGVDRQQLEHTDRISVIVQQSFASSDNDVTSRR